MLLGLVAPKLKEVTSPRNDRKEHISLVSVRLIAVAYRVQTRQIQQPQSPAPEEKVAPGQIVDEVAQKVLSGMPLRFINLNTGTFSSSAELLRVFKRSPEYQTLVSDKSLTPDELAEQAEDVIRK